MALGDGVRLMLLGGMLVSLGCSSGTSQPAECGNGVVEAGEQCDDGEANSNRAPDSCRLDCRSARCGDRVVDTGEECDDGNTADGDGCSSGCLVEVACGDGVCDVAHDEGCDVCPEDCCPCGDGACDVALGETCARCPEDCCPDCGNGVLDAREECDDGNTVSGDGCSATCTDEDGHADCGNGIWERGEECEDGNVDPGDGCSPTCKFEYVCGNSVCETTRGETCRRCPHDCCPNCGNGVLDAGEQCDPASSMPLTCQDLCYDGGVLDCTDWCELDASGCTGTPPQCGDGHAECGEQCDGADIPETCSSLGHAGGTIGCTSSCTFDVSQCGPLLCYLRQDFDGTAAPSDWTFAGDWQWGTPSVYGPSAAQSGASCAGTRIAGNYNNGLSWTTDTLTSPPLNLTVAVQPVLAFYLWLSCEHGFDGGNVKLSTDGGATFQVITSADYPYSTSVNGQQAWSGSLSGWHRVTVDLGAYVGQPNVVLQFGFRSDGSVQGPGFYVDSVAVCEEAALPASVPATLP